MSMGPGDLVVCVDDAINPWATQNGYGYSKAPYLTKGFIYTVTGHGKLWCGVAGFFLKETRFPDGDWPFDCERFRPVDEDSLDIFRKLAEPTDVLVE